MKKIGIGLWGSSSHFNDWFMLKGVIKKIASDIEIQKKCRFVLAGYIEGDKEWQKIINMLQVHKNMEVLLIPAKPIDSYMEMLEDIDICIQPLQDNFFNRAKSALKLAECSQKDILFITSPLYKEKELTACLIANTPSEYYSWIKWCLKDDNLEVYRRKLSAINRKESNFPLKIDRLRQAIEIVLNRKEKTPENLKIFSITYDNSQFGEYTNYDNSHIRTVEQKSYLFEYNPIQDIIANRVDNLKDEDYLGIFSYKFPLKSQISSKMLYKLFEEQQGDSDVYGFSPSLKNWGVGNNDFLKWTEYQHPGFMELFNKIAERLGLEVKETGNVVYSNFMVMKKKYWIDYVNNYIKPAISLMEGEFKELAIRDAKYKGGLPSEKLKEVTGADVYFFHTFILERLINLYISQKGLKFKQVL